MKTFTRLLLASLLVLCTVPSPTRIRGDQRDFWVLNDTGYTIDRLYVSPHESGNWEDDLLGSASLPNQLGFKVTFGSRYISSCVMDVKVVYEDDSSQVYTQGMDVCQLQAVDLHPSQAIFLRSR
jgi:hypothetical protein